MLDAMRYSLTTTTLGSAWIVGSLDVLDTIPAILASGLPVFLQEEIETLRAMPDAERERAWRKREAAIRDENAMRKENPQRSVHG